MSVHIVVACRGGLYLHIDPLTGHIINAGAALDIPVYQNAIEAADRDGSSDLTAQYGWHADTVYIAGVQLPREQIGALAKAVDTGNVTLRRDILRHAGRHDIRQTHADLGGAA